MNENINLCEILKDCPKGTKLWSPVWGRVTFETTDVFDDLLYVRTHKGVYITLDRDRKFDTNGECIIFPSKDQRDWSKFERFWDKPKVGKFDPKTLQPFDKILVRNSSCNSWVCDLFSYIKINIRTNKPCLPCFYPIVGLNQAFEYCVPYNEETKHLVGKKEDCPEYYKWWEE